MLRSTTKVAARVHNGENHHLPNASKQSKTDICEIEIS